MNLLEILDFSKTYLEKKDFQKPRLEAEKVIAYVMNVDRISLYSMFDNNINENQKKQIKEILKDMTNNSKTFSELKLENKNYKEENLKLLNQTAEYFKNNNVENYKMEAEYIFSEVLKISRNLLSISMFDKISEEQKTKIREMSIKRAKEKIPLQYILGRWEFYGNEFITDKRALIPRSDTEILVEQSINILKNINKANVLEIGVGSGAISLSIAKILQDIYILGIDVSASALSLAEENKKLHNVKNVKFIESNLFEKLTDEKYKNKFDFILSNPPYICKEEYENLMPEVRLHEPAIALTDYGTGLYFYKEIAKKSREFLKDDGYLAFEVGYNQSAAVAEILEENDFYIVGVFNDFSNIERVVIAKKGESHVDTFE